MIKKCALSLLVAGGVWFSAAAFDWAPKPTAELKADCIRFARENGYGAFADRIEREANLTDWIDETVRFCEARLAESEGAEFTDPDRRRALMLLDYPLHVDNFAANTPPAESEAFEKSVLAYARRAIARVLREVREAKVAPGSLRAWHVYNMSYVLKGSEHTVLIDFTSYPFSRTEGSWTDADWQALAEIGDVLVITHPHRDHTSFPLMKRMRALGKPLVLPCAMTNRMDRSEFYEPGEGVVVLDTDHLEPVEVAGVKFRNFMGFQGNVPCNTYQIEIDGIRVADNGDNSPKEREWGLAKCPPTDIIISSTWSWVTNIVTACAAAPGFQPERAVFLPSHDNELMHTVPHRESYREMYTSPARLGCPNFAWPRVFPLAFGESFTFRRLDKRIPKCSDEQFLEFFRNGNRTHYQEPFGQRLGMVEKACDGDFELLSELLREIAYERTWLMPAHDQRLDNFYGRCIYIDLGSGMRAAALAKCIRLYRDKLAPDAVRAVERELRRRIFAPYLRMARGEKMPECERVGEWWFTTGNNWNAVCHSCVVRAAIDMNIPERDEIIAAALAASPFYRDGFADDGYCSEGIGYWNFGFGYYLMMGLAAREATDGKVDFFADPKWRKVMEYAYGYMLDEKISPCFADGGGSRENSFLALGEKVWPDLKGGKLPLRTLFPDGQVCLMRTDDLSFAVAVKGGHNEEFHNHNDLGSYVVLADGQIVAGDPGGEVYTARTFSSRRYESKVLSSYAHPVPVVDGQLQGTGRKFAAKIVRTDFTDAKDVIAFDLTAGYPVKTLRRLVRTFTFDRAAKRFTVRDEVEFSKPTAFAEVWVAQDAKTLPKCSFAPAGAWSDEPTYEKIENPGKADVHRHLWSVSKPVTAATFEVAIGQPDCRAGK